MKHTNWTKLLSVVPATLMALVMVAFTGCSTEAPNAPTAAQTYVGEDVPFARAAGQASSSLSSGSGDWYEVASKTAHPNRQTRVEGSRYYLFIPKGAVSEATEITISEHDSNVLDVELGTHGTVFDTPVTFRLDYEGTNLDPDSPNYDGSSPAVFWQNLETGAWEEVPGTDIPSSKEYYVKLEHFSRYALFGTPGW